MVCFKATPWRKSQNVYLVSFWFLKFENFITSIRMRNAPGFSNFMNLYAFRMHHKNALIIDITSIKIWDKFLQDFDLSLSCKNLNRIEVIDIFASNYILAKKACFNFFFLSQLTSWKEFRRKMIWRETWIPATYEFKEKVILHAMIQVVSTGELILWIVATVKKLNMHGK